MLLYIPLQDLGGVYIKDSIVVSFNHVIISDVKIKHCSSLLLATGEYERYSLALALFMLWLWFY